MEIFKKRLIIVTGHYGSGKTNLSVNLAFDLARSGKKACLVDMDIVNPYFRAADSRKPLEQAGVRVIAPVYANTNLDIPALPAEIYAAFEDKSLSAILDVGGDDAGAAALGRFSSLVLAENNFTHLSVVNARRALTQTPEQAVEILKQIETAGRVPVTGLVNNTNLALETDPGIVKESDAFIREVSVLSGVPVVFTCVRRDLADKLSDSIPDVYPVEIYVKSPW